MSHAAEYESVINVIQLIKQHFITIGQEFLPDSLCVYNQESDSSCLFTFDGPVGRHDKSLIVTQIGWICMSSHSVKIVFINDKKVQIASCSINQEKTLIGFSTCEYKQEHDDQKPEVTRVFDAFIAEICPQNRLFGLNIKRPNFIKVQFLWPKRQQSHESQLLVLLHNHSVGLYNIPLRRISSQVAMGEISSPQNLCPRRRIRFCQWDAQTQRLYLVSHVTKDTHVKRYHAVLNCYLFRSAFSPELVYEAPLPFDIPLVSSKYNFTYLNPGPYNIFPETELNMSVIMQPSGAMSVCLQCLQARRSSSTSSQTSPRHKTLEYLVYMVHTACMLQCTVDSVPTPVAEEGRLCFSTHGEYVCVSLPQRLMHLICVSPEYYPSNHLLQQDFSCDEIAPNTFTVPFASSSGVNVLFDVSSGTAVRPVLDQKWLVNYFRYGNTSARLAVINYAAVQKRDTPLVRQLFDVLKEDPWSPSVQQVLSEYLVGSTYVSFKRHVADKQTMYLIPFSTQDSNTATRLQSGDGEVSARVTYTPVPIPESLLWAAKSFARTANRKGSQELRGHEAALMKLLASGNVNQRFSTSMIAKLHQSNLTSDEELKRLTDRRASESTVLSKLTAKAKSLVSGSRSTSTSPAHADLSCPPEAMSDANTVLSDSLLQQTQDSLSQHLLHHLKADSRIKVLQLAAEYCSCMTQQSRNLWSMLIASAYGEVSPTIEYNVAGSASVAEQRLFYLLERFWYALDKHGFPRPAALPYTMAVFGFKTLDFNVFLEYIDNDVISPSMYFVKQVIKELPDSEWGINCKESLLNRLHESEAEQCRNVWTEADSQQHKVRSSLSHLFNEASSSSTSPVTLGGKLTLSGRMRSDSRNSAASQVKTSELPPYIASLVEHLRVRAASLRLGPDISEENIVEAAQAHLNAVGRDS